MTERQRIIAAIVAERERQVAVEHYDDYHDGNRYDHGHGELAHAAACYAMPATARKQPAWPSTWLKRHDKRKQHDRQRQLVIAAALIIAELERLARANAA